MNVQEFLARNRRNIWRLSDCNGIWIHNHLICKWTLNHLAKLTTWSSCFVSTYLNGVFDCMFLSYQVRFLECICILYLPEFKGAPCSKQANKECKFTLKHVPDMIRTYSQMHRTDKYSQQSSIIWSVWLNGWVFVYELNCCAFESRCSHLNFRYRACYEQGIPGHSGNYREKVHSKTRTWHYKNIQTVSLSKLKNWIYTSRK